MKIARYTKTINEYQQSTESRNGIAYTTQYITRNHNERDLEIYSITIDKWLNEKERLKYNDLPKRLQTHNNTEAFLESLEKYRENKNKLSPAVFNQKFNECIKEACQLAGLTATGD